ncbi:MAG: hypothetical protein WCO06_04430 [Candidatus Roizmanbacteria bacterium]
MESEIHRGIGNQAIRQVIFGSLREGLMFHEPTSQLPNDPFTCKALHTVFTTHCSPVDLRKLITPSNRPFNPSKQPFLARLIRVIEEESPQGTVTIGDILNRSGAFGVRLRRIDAISPTQLQITGDDPEIFILLDGTTLALKDLQNTDGLYTTPAVASTIDWVQDQSIAWQQREKSQCQPAQAPRSPIILRTIEDLSPSTLLRQTLTFDKSILLTHIIGSTFNPFLRQISNNPQLETSAYYSFIGVQHNTILELEEYLSKNIMQIVSNLGFFSHVIQYCRDYSIPTTSLKDTDKQELWRQITEFDNFYTHTLSINKNLFGPQGKPLFSILSSEIPDIWKHVHTYIHAITNPNSGNFQHLFLRVIFDKKIWPKITQINSSLRYRP